MESVLDIVISRRPNIIAKIKNSELPRFLLDDFPIVMANKNSTLNIIFGDSGVGKTYLNQCLMHSVLEKYGDDVVIFWVDLEFQADISKERKVDIMLEDYENFHLVEVDYSLMEDFKRATGKAYTNARFVYFLARDTANRYSDKKIIFFIDSLEDMVDDTNDDKEIKRIFAELLRLEGITFIFSHHISKKDTSSSMKFRGSMVIKAKLSSLLFIEKKEDINDFEAEYSIEIVKMRALWNGNRKVLVRVDKQDIKIKDVNKNLDSLERKVIRSAYFLLRKVDKMKKTELIEAISKQVKVNKQSVRNIIEKNNDLFTVIVGMHNTQVYSLNIDKIDEMMALAGLDNDLSEVKKELVKVVDEFIEAGKDNISVSISSNGSVIEFKKLSTIKSSIYRLSDYEVGCILEKLSKLNDDDSVEF